MGAGSSAKSNKEQEKAAEAQQKKLVEDCQGDSGKREEIEKLFADLDTNKDGVLSFQEAERVLKEFNAGKGVSSVDLQRLFSQIDSNGDGSIDKKEFIDFICDGKRPVPAFSKLPPAGEADPATVRDPWKDQTLEAHNKLRAIHGADPLTWNDECYTLAKKQADHCQSIGSMEHGSTDGPSGPHGQNIFWSSVSGATAEYAARCWYDEVDDPGYNFDSPGFQGGTGHFTQVVWKGTTSVGMATSEDGKFIVANYFPAGNFMGDFPENVLPKNGEAPAKPDAPVPTCQGGAGFSTDLGEGSETVEATEMTPELEALFEGCPYEHFKAQAVDAFGNGSTVKVSRLAKDGSNEIKMTITTGGCASMASASWGGGCH